MQILELIDKLQNLEKCIRFEAEEWALKEYIIDYVETWLVLREAEEELLPLLN